MMESQAFGSMLNAHSVVYRRFSSSIFVFVVVARSLSIDWIRVVLRSLRAQQNATKRNNNNICEMNLKRESECNAIPGNRSCMRDEFSDHIMPLRRPSTTRHILVFVFLRWMHDAAVPALFGPFWWILTDFIYVFTIDKQTAAATAAAAADTPGINGRKNLLFSLVFATKLKKRAENTSATWRAALSCFSIINNNFFFGLKCVCSNGISRCSIFVPFFCALLSFREGSKYKNTLINIRLYLFCTRPLQTMKFVPMSRSNMFAQIIWNSFVQFPLPIESATMSTNNRNCYDWLTSSRSSTQMRQQLKLSHRNGCYYQSLCPRSAAASDWKEKKQQLTFTE